MPRAYGADRLRDRRDGSFVLLCPFPKGWVARKARTNTSPEIPGTAVYWDDSYWEVVRADAGAEGRVSYHLVPMEDSHTIRSFDGYSAEHEAARAEAHRRELVRRKTSLFGSVFAFVLGLLPHDVQRELESEIGVGAERMTMLSAIPFLLFGVFCATKLEIEGLPKPAHPWPAGIVQAGLLLFGEALFRLRSALAGQPIGEMFVAIPYHLFIAPIRRRSIPAVAKPQPHGMPVDVIVRDAFNLREPFLALLSPDEQRQLQRVFSFDPIAWGKRTATVLLIMAIIGVVVGIGRILQPSPGALAVLSMLAALAVAIEQVIRFAALGRGEPAGSFLAPLFRPFAKRLFDPHLFDLPPSGDSGDEGDGQADDQR